LTVKYPSNYYKVTPLWYCFRVFCWQTRKTSTSQAYHWVILKSCDGRAAWGYEMTRDKWWKWSRGQISIGSLVY